MLLYFIVSMTHSAICASKKIARSQKQNLDGHVRTVDRTELRINDEAGSQSRHAEPAENVISTETGIG